MSLIGQIFAAVVTLLVGAGVIALIGFIVMCVITLIFDETEPPKKKENNK